MKGKIGVQLSNLINVTQLTSAFYYDFPSNFNYDGERHDGWEFVYVDKGKMCAEADDKQYIINRGEIVCHKPFEFHRLFPYEENCSAIIFCFFCCDCEIRYFENKILKINQRQKEYLNDIVNYSKLFLLPKTPLDIVKDGGMVKSPRANAVHEQYLKNTIELLILSLMTSEVTYKQERMQSYDMSNKRKILTTEIIKYLNENIDKQIKLSEISEKFSYSVSSIKRIFKNETGFSIIMYLNNLRIEKAKYLLKTTSESIENIAGYTGYEDIQYFSSCFKKKVLITPTQYRKEYKM